LSVDGEGNFGWRSGWDFWGSRERGKAFTRGPPPSHSGGDCSAVAGSGSEVRSLFVSDIGYSPSVLKSAKVFETCEIGPD
jgi:hypothetical protein